ncbi:hypothetical protein EFA69_17890 [Rufibacter immobilis]|uniref:Uncharacterized protein n=1 Tax=Rufibacter immobilis TaxID=1348778 RepID=A0A3M9MR40_9BACT|nr:hypothetical protein [Rufibacter immobilis]RNI27959.1 hypothetical protein EFA69_17890 [Rufibacter immobilis]
MTRAFVTYLLSLTILFLGGYNHLPAQVQQKGSLYIPAKEQKAATLASVGLFQLDTNFILSTSPTKVDKAIDKIAGTENQVEEEESERVKDSFGGADLLPALYYGFILAFLLGNLKQILLLCQQIAYSIYRRWYLLFLVFRI